MKLRFGVLAALLATTCALVVAPTVAAAKPASSSTVTAPITGTFTNALGTTGNLVGTFALDRIAVQNGQLVAIGTLTATLTDAAGNVTNTLTQAVALPVAATGSCTILDLTLGPLHLDLLGLVVDLNQVHLQITAQSGSGQLLGNLLCAVAHLLDSNASGTALSNLLNAILGLLG
jgi:hypothetical protein